LRGDGGTVVYFFIIFFLTVFWIAALMMGARRWLIGVLSSSMKLFNAGSRIVQIGMIFWIAFVIGVNVNCRGGVGGFWAAGGV
jgi:hypothetical protein